MSHTPGPWYATEDDFVRQSLDLRLYVVSLVEIPNRQGGEKAKKSNALLIAAAPELLDAARKVSVFASLCGGMASRPSWFTDDTAWEAWVNASAATLAAIAKATEVSA